MGLGIVLAILATGYCVWRHVPSLDYLPVGSSWQVEAKNKWSSCGHPCIYWRYRVPEAPAELADKLRAAVNRVANGPPEEYSSQELRAAIAQRFRLPGSHTDWPGMLNLHSAPTGGARLAVRTDSPFRVMWWFMHGDAVHHYIVVRVIDIAPATSLVEVWDYQLFDA